MFGTPLRGGEWIASPRTTTEILRVTQNDAEAFRWYKKAADQGDAKCQTIVALMYLHGRGVSEDDAEALRWYNKAAGQGYAVAEYDLGNVDYYGQGVNREDRAEADRWYHKAAEQGFDE